MSKNFGKATKVLSYGSALIDVGVGIYDNIKNGESALHIISDAVSDAAITGGSVWIIATVLAGATGPVGAVLAALATVGAYVFTDMAPVKGKTVREWVKTGARYIVDNTANLYHDVKADLTDLYYDAKYLFGF